MGVNKTVVIGLIVVCCLSGCGGARFGLGKGGGKITVPFDPPYDRRIADEQPIYESTKDLPI